MDILKLQKELRKRYLLPHTWHYKYDAYLDAKSNFIYSNYNFDEIIEKTEKLSEDLRQYAINRWYNYWCDKGLYLIFTNHEIVTPNYNHYNEIETITIQEINFKIRSQVYPNQFARTLRYALLHKEELLYWLYRRIRKSNLHPLNNHIFVVFYQRDGDHWKLKAELYWLRNIIFNYLDHFDLQKVVRLNIQDNITNYADIIWCVKLG